jgi:probable rRNA maturation factor
MTDPEKPRQNKIATEGRAEIGPSCLFCKLCFNSAGWSKVVILRKRIAGLNSATLERFVLRARRVVGLRDTVNVLVTSSAELRSLNHRFRGADKATDVLSFPAPQVSRQAKRVSGEVAISADIARDNAERLGHSMTAEVKILVLHGILHLAGFDHERDNGEMARKESRLRRQLKLEGSLIERTQARDRPPVAGRRTR